MKSLIVLVLSIVVSVSFIGCGGATKSKPKPKPVVKQEKKVVKKPVKKVDTSILAYAKDKDVFEVDEATLKKLLSSDEKKQNKLERNVLKILDILRLKTSLNLKDISNGFANIKQSKNDIVIVGTVGENYDKTFFGYVLFFDKKSLNINKLYVFKNTEVFDISSDMLYALTNKVKRTYPKKGGVIEHNKINKYSFKTNRFKMIVEKKYDVEYLQFSPLEKYVVFHIQNYATSSVKSSFYVYDINTNRELLSRRKSTKYGAEYEFSFSQNEKYMALYEGGTSEDSSSNLILYSTTDFKKVKKFMEKSNSVPSLFVITNKYLIVRDRINSNIYNLDTKETIEGNYLSYGNPFMVDADDNNLFYSIAHKEYTIHYVIDNELYLIKKIPKREVVNDKALLVDNKIYLFPMGKKNKNDVIDIPVQDIKNYNLAFAKVLNQAKQFYTAGFKNKAMKEYKKALKNKDFDEYFKSVNMSVDAFIDLEKYKSTKDTKYLESYILKALEAKYLKEAKKALNTLNRSPNKNAQKYLILHSAYLAEIGKEEEAYNTLVESMPFSKESVNMVKKYVNSNLKLYKDKSKVSLIFKINKNSISYKNGTKSDDFVSFNGELLGKNSKSASKSKKIVSKKPEAIELLD
ncbi:MAG: hypothetical protein GQ474_03865 [Sulfurimonas sp.]|nr:hypothetical protein [Sulfurimonas sp.]